MLPVKARLELREPGLADDLVDFLRRRKWEAEQAAAVIDVEFPHLAEEKAGMELELLLRVWQSLHDGVAVDIVRP
jgi:hypothetical protein